MTDDEIVANSFGFLFAGNETTASTLSLVSYLLAVNPDIQEKLQSEIDAYFEDKPVSNLQLANIYLHISCQLPKLGTY
jgi:cytochrome P450